MIIIDNIQKRNHEVNYRFPTIDFKFQNTGNATAFLWKFVIEILCAEIDVTPVLQFGAAVKLDEMLMPEFDRRDRFHKERIYPGFGNSDLRKRSPDQGHLSIWVSNQGWGAANDLSIAIEQETLGSIFEKQALQYNGIIQSGSRKEVFLLDKDSAIQDRAREIEDKFTEIGYRSNVYGIKLRNFYADWSCKDEKEEVHQGKSYIRGTKGAYGSYFALSTDGFIEIEHGPPCGIEDSKVTYICIVDPMKGAHEYTYTISHSIAPGSVERFHIMMGSEKSCHLRAKFKFYIDKSKTVESEGFDISIWNPRNSGWHRDYEDGSQIQRESKVGVSQASQTLSISELKKFAYQQMRNSRKLKQIALFPFVMPAQNQELDSGLGFERNLKGEYLCPACGDSFNSAQAILEHIMWEH